MAKRFLLLAIAVAVPALAHAQTLLIGGGVYEDRPALAMRTSFLPLGGVTVKLYRDGGDRAPSADDAMIATTATKKDGLYAFRVNQTGNYWVSVDSKTIHASAWPEQTFGPAGSLCARPDGTSVTTHVEGACFGGRTFNSDEASALATAEHVAAVTLGSPLANVDFAFSFEAVTTTADGDRVQGSLRQFLNNANAVPGPNRMRFVPLPPAPEQRETIVGTDPRWWTITHGSPLPALSDADTVLDGTAYNFVVPSSIANIHPGRIGEAYTMQTEDLASSRQQKPELELVLTGSEGIVCTARCGIKAIAVRGTPVAVIMRADARIEHVMIGSSPEAAPSATRGVVGLQIERGLTVARHVLVTAQSNAGVAVGPDGRLDAEHLDVSRCGEPLRGAGIVLLSSGSSIRTSNVSANPGAGIVIGAIDGTRAVSGNVIDGTTISNNQAGVILSPGASRNVITRNDIMWNRLGGVTIAPFEKAPPTENRLSANRYDENGLRPIVLNLTTENPNQLARAGTCERVAGAANMGVSAPLIRSAVLTGKEGDARVTIRGRACPGQVVEIYQSFVTSSVREQAMDMPRIRESQDPEGESVTTQSRPLALPSIGEFNYLGATTTLADGTFEVTFPFPIVKPTEDPIVRERELDIWAREVLRGADPTERAFSAIAIDPAGNTSEMSVRRQVEKQLADQR